MSKLTAERARERITHLKRWQEQRGLTLREEEYLEALELALEVLEAKADATLYGTGFVMCKYGQEPERVDPMHVHLWYTGGASVDGDQLREAMTTPPEFGHHNLPRDQETKRYAKD